MEKNASRVWTVRPLLRRWTYGPLSDFFRPRHTVSQYCHIDKTTERMYSSGGAVSGSARVAHLAAPLALTNRWSRYSVVWGGLLPPSYPPGPPSRGEVGPPRCSSVEDVPAAVALGTTHLEGWLFPSGLGGHPRLRRGPFPLYPLFHARPFSGVLIAVSLCEWEDRPVRLCTSFIPRGSPKRSIFPTFRSLTLRGRGFWSASEWRTRTAGTPDRVG